MINFAVSPLIGLMTEIRLLVTVSSNNKRLEALIDVVDLPPGGDFSPAARAEALKQSTEGALRCVELTGRLLSWLTCPHVDHAAKRLHYWATKPEKDRDWDTLFSRAVALREAIETELRAYSFYLYQKNKAEKLKAWEAEWQGCLKAFPSTKADVFAATDCYALQHNTACVFHCMRILETGLKALASSVGLKFDVQQWKNIIDQIEAEIEKIRDNGIPDLSKAEKDARLQFLSEAAKEFFYFKDGWRNHVSHNRGAYDEHQALSTLEHVRAFMNHLSKHLSE